MNGPHYRLIYADETRPGYCTHHTCVKNGTVMDGHPRLCSDHRCRQWGVESMQEKDPGEQERLDAINAELRGDNDEGMAVIAWTVIGAAFVFCVVAAIFIVRYL